MKALLLSALISIHSAHAATELAPAGLDPAYAAKAIALSIECTEKATPHYYEKVPGEGGGNARKIHPAFFGCFDWHSAVHGHWAMMRVLDRFPDLPAGKEARRILNDHLTKEKLEKELAYFKANEGFERPYGWAWYLRLAEEAARSAQADAGKWRAALAPLEEHLAQAAVAYLAKVERPTRQGLHNNTAFALTHFWDYAETKGNAALRDAVKTRAVALFGEDKNCPLDYEPSAGDFISPCFTEADLMRRVMAEKEYRRWLNAFLPTLKDGQLAPAVPEDKKDYFLGHLIGLMYEKAAAMRAVAESLPKSDFRHGKLLKAATVQANKGWELMFDSGYGGTHWIASFAIFYYDRAGLTALPPTAGAGKPYR